MESKELDKRYRNICRDISDGRIRKAINGISRLLREEGKGDYIYRLENLSANYKSLLNYAFKGYRDPRQQEILNNLCISLLSIADEVYHEIREKELVQTKLERILLKKEFGD